MNIFKNTIFNGVAICSILLATACSKDFLETTPTLYPEESDVVGTMQDDPSQVQAYVTGAYSNFYCGGDYWASHDDFGIPAIKLATDFMCEDIAYPRDIHWFCYDYQLDNRMSSYRRTSSSWRQLYQVVDNANTIITMLKPAEGEEVTDQSIKTKLGAAYSLRAYSYFWLVNLWQHPLSVGADQPGVPLKTETEYRMERVSVGEIYNQIKSDIEIGYNYLKGLGYYGGNKVDLTEYAAAAIYANVLMFTGDYDNAAKYAEAAAEGGSFNSETDMLSGFNSLSMPEVIWGFNVNNENTGYYASFFSQVDPYMIGYGGQVGIRKLISSDLYSKIADNDVRKKWFGYNPEHNILEVSYDYETNYSQGDLTPYIQNKFVDIYITSRGSADAFTSALIYFRSGEMYFVASEAYYLAGNEAKAKELLNAVMATRIPEYSFTGSGSALYDEICLQKRIDTWMEGSRYLDAKRRNEQIDRSTSMNHALDLTLFNAITYSSRDYRMLYHFPNLEMENNPELGQDNQ
ncbi:MAG: RagB/SusD family nutrient uptake outer membrane protein [Mediterranea sp.]|jgi:hypothetical protein|nr:RagB/SusD family nutrient uptake outer membrane protein [Mediterranea sp.]